MPLAGWRGPTGEAARRGIARRADTRHMTDIQRHITRRDARAEGEPDVEPSADMSDGAVAMKEAQRDLTSLSGPVPPHAQPAPKD